MKRLQSFGPVFHVYKRPVSALDCAKHGWKDTKEVDKVNPLVCIVSCDNCESKMYVIPIDSDHESLPKGNKTET